MWFLTEGISSSLRVQLHFRINRWWVLSVPCSFFRKESGAWQCREKSLLASTVISNAEVRAVTRAQILWVRSLNHRLQLVSGKLSITHRFYIPCFGGKWWHRFCFRFFFFFLFLLFLSNLCIYDPLTSSLDKPSYGPFFWKTQGCIF